MGSYYCPKNRLPMKYGTYSSDGEELVPAGFFNQMLYPVKQNIMFIKKKLGKRK